MYPLFLEPFCKGVSSKAHCIKGSIPSFTLLPLIPCSRGPCTISVKSPRHWLSLIGSSSLDGTRSVVTALRHMMHTKESERYMHAGSG